MQIIMNSSIAKLLNQSPIPAAIINGQTDNIWYNDAYINTFKDFPNLIDAMQNLFSMSENKVFNFINSRYSEKLEAKYKDVKYYALKEYRKSINESINFTIISIIPENKYNYNTDCAVITEEYFFMNVPQPCVIFDFHTKKIETANNAFSKICGIPVEHIRNMYIASLFHESAHIINKYLNSNLPYNKTFLISYYNLLINKTMIFEVIPIIKKESQDCKKEYKVIFMLRDIFGEIEIQRDQISEDFLCYQFLTRSISDGILIVNNGIIIDVNNAVCNLWHYDKEELINQPLSLLIPDASQYIDNVSIVKGSSIMFVGVRKDKTQFNGALKVQSFDNLNKYSMVYIVRDLTEHIAVARLMENQTDFTSEIFNIQPNMIAVFNENHMLTRCNKVFLDFFGYASIEEAIHNIGDISSRFLDSNDNNMFITNAHKDNWFILPIEHQNIEYMVGMNDKTGNYNIFNIKSTLMENNTNTFYVVSFTNITETIEKQRCIKEANNLISSYSDYLKNTLESNMLILAQYQKLATIGTMIGFITHQWIQPLNAIGLIAQNTEDILEEDDEFDKEELVEMMQSIMNHVMFMSETMENFKNFFKSEDISVPFKVSQAVKSIMVLLTPVLKKSNIEVIYDMPSQFENLKVFGVTNDLKQVIMNIIVNGKDSIVSRKEKKPELKGQITIKIDTHNDERIILSITDNGSGLSEEDLRKIFEMHYTTKGSQGTGIGMYMAQIIIEKKMNGILNVKNRDDGEKGAQIILNLPIHKGK